MMKYRPIYYTGVDKSISHVNKHNSDVSQKQFEENFELTQGFDADLELRSLYIKQAYLIYDTVNRTIKLINSKTG